RLASSGLKESPRLVLLPEGVLKRKSYLLAKALSLDWEGMNQPLIQYSYLQVLDFMTTVAFLMNGVREGNPLIRWVLDTPHPISGLLGVKVLAALLGIYCWKAGRMRLLGRMNILFAVIVAWNLAALIVAAAQQRAI